MSATILPPLTEKQWMQQIQNLGHTLGWTTYHPWLSIRSPRGFPDLTCAKEGRLPVFIECKTETGKVTAAQQEWIDLLATTGCTAFVARPSDWDLVCEALR